MQRIYSIRATTEMAVITESARYKNACNNTMPSPAALHGLFFYDFRNWWPLACLGDGARGQAVLGLPVHLTLCILLQGVAPFYTANRYGHIGTT